MHDSKWFNSLPSHIRSEVAARVHRRWLAAGTVLFWEGDPNTGLHCLLSGCAHVSGVSSAGDDVLMTILYPGDWTGFLPNLDGGRHALTVRLVERSEVATLTPSAVRAIFEVDVARHKLLAAPELAVARRNYRYMIEQQGGPTVQRLAYRLLDLARGPHGDPFALDKPLIEVSQAQVASATLLSRQKVNALLGQLGQQGLVICSRGQVRLVDIEGLARLARFHNDDAVMSPK